jgi:hypothetical protein
MFRRKKTRKSEEHPDFPRMEATSYRDVIAAVLAANGGAQRYLEIGSRSGDSIARVDCSYIAVDPEFAIKANVWNGAPQMMFFQQTSDDFFASQVMQKLGWVPDVAFIDGMHWFEYALRDFMNAEAAMAPGGTICIHDVCPFNYECAEREPGPESTLTGWTGDVWKVVMALLDLRPDLSLDIVSAHRTGLAVIRNLDPQSTVLRENYDALMDKYLTMDLEAEGAAIYYDRFRLTSPDTLISGLS